MANELRFGVVSESVPEGRAWLEHARRIEGEGVAALLLRDHFSAGAFGPQLAPFSALAAAATVTERLRVGTMVLCNDFRHPAIVAHEAATLHQLSGGRFELGLGAGWYQPEYAAAGIGFDPPGQRISRLEESLAIIAGLLDRRPVRLIVRRGWAGLGVDAVWEMPTLFIGSLEQIRADLLQRRAKFGLSYLITSDTQLPVLADVISGL
jgi:alkanesulfonate monooxygenase SsuD/methylene tetrahydromethanopterin reductase-like flavin-dependent oxidoreductase (luciferase family)